MGFLDRLVADLVARETGLPVRGLVRRAGVGRLVAAGGLLAAGAAAVDWVQKQQGEKHQGGMVPSSSGPTPPWPPPGSTPTASSGSSRATHGPNLTIIPPPLPAASRATPSSSSLPPLPPLPSARIPEPAPERLPGERAAEDGLTATQRFAIARTVIAAALADGVLAEHERSIIEGHLEASDDLSEPQRQRLRRDLVVPATISELTEATAADPTLALPMFRAAALVVSADGHSDALETTWLARFGDGLGIDPANRAKVDHQLRDALAAANRGSAP